MFALEEITTADGLVHQGVVAYPAKPNGTVIVWVHGLTGTFYGDVPLMNFFGEEAIKNGYTFASFNTRGHDMVTGIHKIDPNEPKGYRYISGGASYEQFEDSRLDIDAVIEFLYRKGCSRVFVIGHSTGANKVCYYAGNSPHPALAGVVLASPISDRLNPGTETESVKVNIRKMKKMIKEGKGDVLLSDYLFFPLTPRRYVSLLSKGTAEDQFDYGDETPNLKGFSHIRVPTCVLFGENDEYADRPVTEIRAVFDRCHTGDFYQSHIISDASHGFSEKEENVVKIIFAWVRALSRTRR